MNKQIKEDWTQALLSGQYTQTEKMLCRPDKGGFCCLGVLTDLYIKEHAGKSWVSTDPAKFDEDWADVAVTGLSLNSEDGNPATLPLEVRKWAGLEISDPIVRLSDNPDVENLLGREDAHLSEINDAGFPFPVIAKFIEEQL